MAEDGHIQQLSGLKLLHLLASKSFKHIGMAHIFWVEDQYHWIDKIKPVLERADFGDGTVANKVSIHRFVESACQAINHDKNLPDIVILDANMNGNDDAGFKISKLVAKKWSQIPVIYLSEHSGTGIEQKAFEQTQAQDFIAKHQQNIEKVICWRIRALLRQQALNLQMEKQKQQGFRVSENSLISGDLVIDLITWNVYWHHIKLMNPTNSKRPLTPMPRKILRYLVESSPRAITTSQMAQKLDNEQFSYDNYRQHIKVLRQSFEQAAETAGSESFKVLTQSGKGIVTFGDDGAYCWIK